MNNCRFFRRLKAIIVGFYLVVFANINVSFAQYQSGGPYAPEFTSFEPIDMTDMVNPAKGNFTYNFPLIEIPGPGGGYPIGLSYHAGIKLNEVSSWVGLGWSLNAGAINRQVRGVADDWINGKLVVNDSNTNNDYRYGFSLGFSAIGAANSSMGHSYNQFTGFAGTASGTMSNKTIFSGGSTALNSSNTTYNYSRGGFTGSIIRERYWIDQNNANNILGSIQGTAADGTTSKYSDRYVLDQPIRNANLTTGLTTELNAGPSFPAYDQYFVAGQGIGGAFEPLILENASLFDKKKEHVDYHVEKVPAGYDVPVEYTIDYKINKLPAKGQKSFRFINDFSNSYEVLNPLNFNLTSNASTTTFPLGSNNLGYNQNIREANGYNATNLKLAGSRHIEYFLNNQYTNPNTTDNARSRGGLDYPELADMYWVGTLNRRSAPVDFDNYSVANQIGGYSITNGAGVTYHYALPVYSLLNTTVYSKELAIYGTTTRTVNSDSPYAYAWLLTAVSGPDYVDRGPNGLPNGVADEYDWGYWVGFSYGKRSNVNYRQPLEQGEFITDADGSKVYSIGQREQFYLNAIYTKTHTALFAKSTKNDGTLKLDEVVLVPNEAILKDPGISLFNNIQAIQNLNQNEPGNSNSQILSAADLSALLTDKKSILKKIVFSYDYSLCPVVNNSNIGKLTLKALTTLGKEEKSIIPATTFEYELTNPKTGNLSVTNPSVVYDPTLYPITENNNNIPLQEGDIIKFNVNGTNYYGVVLGNFGYNMIRAIGPKPPVCSNIKFATTKNPPYIKNAYDLWGMFKSDYVGLDNTYYNNDLIRYTSPNSAQTVDAWSLRRINTGAGGIMNIEYESNRYEQVAVSAPNILNFNSTITGFYKYDNSSNYFTLNGYNLNKRNGNPAGTLEKLQFSLKETELQFLLNKIPVGTWLNINAIAEIYDNNNVLVNSSSVRSGSVQIEEITSNGVTIKDPNNVLIPSASNGKVIYYAAFLELPPAERFGDGIRTKSISLLDGLGSNYKTAYEYKNGTTSLEPFGMDAVHIPTATSNANFTIYNKIVINYKKLYTDKFSAIAPELPAPGVIQGECIRKQYVNDNLVPSYDKYVFKTFASNQVLPVEEYYNSIASTSPSYSYSHETRTLRIKDYTAQVGQLLGYYVYDSKNALILQTQNNYSSDASLFNNQGVLEQAHHEHRIITQIRGTKIAEGPFSTGMRMDPAWTKNVAVHSIKSRYPSILTGTITTDYKKGITTETKNLEYDFYSGIPTKVLNVDAYGNRFLSSVIPAYSKFPGMGLKVNYVINKNMLLQSGANYAYKVNSNNQPIGLVAGTGQIWENSVNVQLPDWTTISNTGIWRPSAAYQWKSPINKLIDGSYPISDFNNQAFNFDKANPNWDHLGTNTLYDAFSHLLTTEDFKGNQSISKANLDQTLIIASGGPGRQSEMAYSGVEEKQFTSNKINDNIWYRADGNTSVIINETFAHTGKKSVEIPAGAEGFICQLNVLVKNYVASVWVRNTNGDAPNARLRVENSGGTEIAGASPVEKRKANGWYLLQVIIPGTSIASAQQLKVVCKNNDNKPLYFDDLKFQPANASFTANVHDLKTNELRFTLDDNNLFTRYDYDDAGRVNKVTRETFNGAKTISETNYVFAGLATSQSNSLNSVGFNTQSIGSRTARINLDGLLNTNGPFKITIYPGAKNVNVTSGFGIVTTSTSITNGNINPAGPFYLTLNANPATVNPSGTFDLMYTNPGMYWIKLFIEDGLGNYRELVRQIEVI